MASRHLYFEREMLFSEEMVFCLRLRKVVVCLFSSLSLPSLSHLPSFILLLLLFPPSLPLFGSPPPPPNKHLLSAHPLPLPLGGEFNTNILYRSVALGSSQGLAPAFTSFISHGDCLAIMMISILPGRH